MPLLPSILPPHYHWIEPSQEWIHGSLDAAGTIVTKPEKNQLEVRKPNLGVHGAIRVIVTTIDSLYQVWFMFP